MSSLREVIKPVSRVVYLDVNESIEFELTKTAAELVNLEVVKSGSGFDPAHTSFTISGDAGVFSPGVSATGTFTIGDQGTGAFEVLSGITGLTLDSSSPHAIGYYPLTGDLNLSCSMAAVMNGSPSGADVSTSIHTAGLNLDVSAAEFSIRRELGTVKCDYITVEAVSSAATQGWFVVTPVDGAPVATRGGLYLSGNALGASPPAGGAVTPGTVATSAIGGAIGGPSNVATLELHPNNAVDRIRITNKLVTTTAQAAYFAIKYGVVKHSNSIKNQLLNEGE